MPLLTKYCPKCHKILPYTDFREDQNMFDGLATYCRKCRREYNRKWNLDNPERRATYTRRWRAFQTAIEDSRKMTLIREQAKIKVTFPVRPTEPTKVCSVCNQPKALSAFAPRKASADGHHSICRICLNKKQTRKKYTHET